MTPRPEPVSEPVAATTKSERRPMSKLAQRLIQKLRETYEREVGEAILADGEAQGLPAGEWQLDAQSMEWVRRV